ncbi:MAG: hypothetical protein KDA41_05700, partial [Planctomycetales bacterium]|nr:hypothetical protein [Planctomycetales bacterium]
TLAQVQSGETEATPLWLAATQPHAQASEGMLAGPTSRRSLEVLRQWIELAQRENRSNSAPPEAVAPAAEPAPPPSVDITPPLTAAIHANIVGPGRAAPERTLPFERAPPKELQRGLPAPPAARDEFDADVFNRRWFPDAFAEKPEPADNRAPANLPRPPGSR